MPRWRLPQPVDVKRGRRWKAAAHDHAEPVAGQAVADGAIDIVPLVAALEHLARDRLREGRRLGLAQKPGKVVLVFAQLAARDGVRGERTRRRAIREKWARFEWFVMRLVGHIAPAAC